MAVVLIEPRKPYLALKRGSGKAGDFGFFITSLRTAGILDQGAVELGGSRKLAPSQRLCVVKLHLSGLFPAWPLGFSDCGARTCFTPLPSALPVRWTVSPARPPLP
jgi:hypothetical protein